MASLTKKIQAVDIDEKHGGDNYKWVIFISNRKLDKDTKKALSGDFKDVEDWRDDFMNRECSELHKAGIHKIWCDITDPHVKEWVAEVIDDRHPYIAVLVYSGSSKNQFVQDLHEHCDISIKMKDLIKLRSLTFEQLLKKASKLIRIHQPPGCIGGCLGGLLSGDKKAKNG